MSWTRERMKLRIELPTAYLSTQCVRLSQELRYVPLPSRLRTSTVKYVGSRLTQIAIDETAILERSVTVTTQR
jgi:hypothetical protein